MDLFFQLLQGSYAYLLFLQLLVVAGLMFALLWLMVQRVRESRRRVATAHIPVTSGDHTHWQSQIDGLEREISDLKVVQDEAQTLREKVRYLESKLMEYEILQEEIGALSQLKLENEQLKKDLVHAQSDPDAKPIPKSPSSILFDSTSTKIDVQPGDPTQAGLDKLLKKIEEMTEGSRKQAK